MSQNDLRQARELLEGARREHVEVQKGAAALAQVWVNVHNAEVYTRSVR